MSGHSRLLRIDLGAGLQVADLAIRVEGLQNVRGFERGLA
jgi:hypothetical protein